MAVFHDQHRIAPTDSPNVGEHKYATVAVGLVSLLAVTLVDLGMDESAATEVEEAFATEPRTGPRVLVGV